MGECGLIGLCFFGEMCGIGIDVMVMVMVLRVVMASMDGGFDERLRGNTHTHTHSVNNIH